MNVLSQILARTRADVARRQAETSLSELERRGAERAARRDLRPFAAALGRSGLSVIAEHKRRSPSAGVIREGVSLPEVVAAYERGGAAAVSVLTEGPAFGGALEDLAAARRAGSLPLLRKDFIVDPYQLAEALAWGADAVLLIVAALTVAELTELRERSGELELAALVEVHDESELQVALSVGAEIVGINNRDLTTLEVDLQRTFELLPSVPDGVTVVAESGFRSRDELDRLAAAGVDAVLIGEALMGAHDIEAACRALTAAGSRAD